MGFPFGGDSGGRSRKNTRKRGWFFAFGLALTGASFLLIFYLNLRFFKEPRMAGAPLYNAGIDLMGTAVGCLLFFGCVGRNTDDRSAFDFGPMILVNSISFLLNACEWYLTGLPEYVKLNLLAYILDDVCDAFLVYFFWRYVHSTLGMGDERTNRWVRLLLVPQVLLISANFFLPILFHMDAEGSFQYTHLHWIGDLYLLYTASVTVFWIARTNAPLRQKAVAVLFTIVPLLHNFVTLNKHGYATREGAILVSILLVYEMLFEERSERLTAAKKELDTAAGIQQSILPKGFQDSADPRFTIHASMEPAREVGGDFYDCFLIDEDHFAVVIADVSDKGVPAGLYMMSAKILLKYRANQGGTPAEILTDVNAELCANNTSGTFVTVWLGILDLSSGKLICANAGHEYPAIRGEDRVFHIFRDPHGFVLGGMEGTKYRDYTLTLAPGDAVFVYTDGVTEANNPAGNLYGLKRLSAALNAASGTPEEILSFVRKDIRTFADGAEQSDDLTMLCLEFRGALQDGAHSHSA